MYSWSELLAGLASSSFTLGFTSCLTCFCCPWPHNLNHRRKNTNRNPEHSFFSLKLTHTVRPFHVGFRLPERTSMTSAYIPRNSGKYFLTRCVLYRKLFYVQFQVHVSELIWTMKWYCLQVGFRSVEVITDRLVGSVAGFDRPIEVYHKWWNGIDVCFLARGWCGASGAQFWYCGIRQASPVLSLLFANTMFEASHNGWLAVCGSVSFNKCPRNDMDRVVLLPFLDVVFVRW
jgi:hypothetical protein